MFKIDNDASRQQQIDALALHLALVFLEKGDESAACAIASEAVCGRLLVDCRATATLLLSPNAGSQAPEAKPADAFGGYAMHISDEGSMRLTSPDGDTITFDASGISFRSKGLGGLRINGITVEPLAPETP